MVVRGFVLTSDCALAMNPVEAKTMIARTSVVDLKIAEVINLLLQQLTQ
jgi:hypothetical protein